MEFTKEQLSAINTRDRTLLVSAAAGSGKTATLTERIIRSVLDTENPIDISDMLIVTFTKATARELGEKISRAIQGALSKDKDNERLKRQLNLLPAARISTIDSFCADVLRSNVEKFGIAPNYRIAEAPEVSILSLSILNSMIDEVFEGKRLDIATPYEFDRLCSCIVGVKKDERLAEHFLMLHDKSKSSIEGAKIFAKLATLHEICDESPLETNIYVKYSISLTKELAGHFEALYEKAQSKMSGATKSEIVYSEDIEKELALVREGLGVQTYEQARSFLSKKLDRKRSVRNGGVTEATEFYSSVRSLYQQKSEELYSKLFTLSASEWRDSAKESRRLLEVLARFIEAFDRVYFEQKRKMGMLEYSDVERLALGVLVSNGEYTDAAMAMKEQFKAVYIDEYQDVSPIQNAIFDAISKTNNRFMVGDIKQSIYGFRSARPEIFVGMKKAFPPLKEGEYNESGSVFMSKNFRSDVEIINFVNEIFDKLFGVTKDSIGYVPDDRLAFGKGNFKDVKKPEVHIFVKPPKDNGDAKEDEDENTQSEENDINDLSPLYLAKKIKELVSCGKLDTGAPITYSDIAILFRKKDSIKRYKKILEDNGIPTEATDNQDFFLNSDVLLMLCLLNAIDNPRRDIYLSGLMCSPLFSFTADEIYRIASKRNGSLYSALLRYCEESGDEKCKYFLRELKRYRALAEGIGVDTLISKLYAETGILNLAAKNGGRNNLMLLLNHAKKYEQNGYKGLYSFISYINNVIEINAKFDVTGESTESNAVMISSVHSSKGLEYPVVFLVETQQTTGLLDKTSAISYKEDFGMGFRLRDKTELALVNNPIKNAVALYQDEKKFEEELRVLYVALTRAREQLYILGKSRKTKDALLRDIELSKAHLSTYSKNLLISFLDAITSTVSEDRITIHDAVELCEDDASAIPESNAQESEFDRKTLLERFRFVYPDLYKTALPEKLSISHLYPTVLDEDEDDAPSIDERELFIEEREILPQFISGEQSDESAKAGIATHAFMQFCDFELLYKNGAEAELARLIHNGFISKDNATRVRINEINKFVRSRLFNELTAAKKVYRELRFNCRLPAVNFTKDEKKQMALEGEELLLQGVIDCIIEEQNGELHLIDYKTDRLTKEELSNRSLAEKKLKEAHSLQLSYYKMAIKKMFSREVSSARIYSLPLGDTVDV